MNRESRIARTELSKLLIEAIQDPKLRARSVKSGTNNLIGYVFLAADYEDRERLIDELYTRCFIIRSHFEEGSKIIGI